jgi:hypothetical protein
MTSWLSACRPPCVSDSASRRSSVLRVLSHTEQLLQKLQKLQAGDSHGIAAVYLRTVTANDQDGKTWRLLASDGSRVVEISATASRTQLAVAGRAELDAATLEAAVEHRAGGFAREHRLSELQNAELNLHAKDLR